MLHTYLSLPDPLALHSDIVRARDDGVLHTHVRAFRAGGEVDTQCLMGGGGPWPPGVPQAFHLLESPLASR